MAGGLACALLVGSPLAAQRTERPTLAVSGYVIDAELDPATHHLAAKATVTFTAPENAEVVSFGFHPALKVTKITDDRASCSPASARPTAPFALPRLADRQGA